MKFARLRALARRMVPGVYIDPTTLLGPCHFCGAPVTYAAGDRDATDRPQHDTCWSEAAHRQLSQIAATRALFEALEQLREIAPLMPLLRSEVVALPRPKTVGCVLTFFARVRRAAFAQRDLTLTERAQVHHALDAAEARLRARGDV